MPVPLEEASRFGIVVADEEGRINDFQEKPKEPRSNLASMGIYIFSWPVLKDALVKMSDEPSCDFGKHVIPYCMRMVNGFLHTSIMAIGKTWELLVRTGKPIWS